MSRGGTRVYFGRLPRDVRERDLEKLVRSYGRVREISIKLGYGFVEFDDSRDADDCVYDLNGKDFLGERIVVEHARNPVRNVDYGYRSRESSSSSSRSRPPPRRGRTPPIRTEHRLAVINLSSRCNWQDLKEYMGKAGEVTFADAHKRRAGEGVVEFATKEDMKTAMKKLDDTELFGRHIKLKVEKVRSRRSASRSRSRSQSRSRRKSRSRSRSRSPKRRHRSTSKSPQHSRSKRSKSRSRSASKDKSREERSKSRSKSPEKSRSPSPKKEHENGDEEVKDVDEVDEEQEAEVDEQEQVEENGEERAEEENMEDDDAEKKDDDDDNGD